jgi:hypothetical protein
MKGRPGIGIPSSLIALNESAQIFKNNKGLSASISM